MTSTPDADERLTGAHDLALAALREITPENTIGPAAGYTVEEDGSVSLRFQNRLAGYPGWFWTVTVAQVEDSEPTVLEAELLPGEGALLAPDWVPWAERLAEYRAHQAEAAAQAEGESATEAADDDAADDDDDDDDDDIDDILHAGDVDGVDIDELDPSAGDPDADDSEEESDDAVHAEDSVVTGSDDDSGAVDSESADD